MWSFNAAGVTFSIDELGNPFFKGTIAASGFTNDELTIDELGNLSSTGTFRFGGATADYIEFDGTNVIVDTPFLQFNSTSAIFGNEATGEYIKYGAGVFEVGPKATIGSNANRTVTVGSGGDYSTLNLALEALSKTIPAYKKGGFTAKIDILSGYTEEDGIVIDGLNFGWIEITSASTITWDSGSTSGPFLSCKNGAVSPLINISITRVGSITAAMFLVSSGGAISAAPGNSFDGADPSGLGLTFLTVDGSSGASFKGCTITKFSKIFEASRGSQIDAEGSIVSASNSLADATLGSTINLSNSTASDFYGFYLVRCFDGSTITWFNDYSKTLGGPNKPSQAIFACYSGSINLYRVTASGAIDGLRSYNGGRISARNCGFLGNSTGSSVASGGIISLDGTSGTLSQTANTITSDGIIFG